MEALQAEFGGLAIGEACPLVEGVEVLLAGGGRMICGLGSSPPSVMARSRLVRGVLQNLTRGDAVPEGAGSPPPSTMRSSAHSQLILYLEWIELNPEESF